MKKTPRPYQVELVSKTAKSLASNKAVILHAPTGAGKSVMIDMIVTGATGKGKTVLVLSDAIKIYRQLAIECQGIEINSRVKEIFIQKGRCYVGMIQTILKRPMIIQQLHALDDDLILLIDECHIATSTKLIDYLPNALRIGLTATPYGRLHGHLPDYYNDLIEGPQVDWLIQNGFLTNYRHIARTQADTSLLQIRNGEVTEESNQRVFSTRAVYDGLFEDLRTVPFKKAVIFVAGIKQADALCERLIDNGFAAVRYHSGMKYGAYELAKFTELHMANILVTIKSLSKGWDYPPVDLVALMHKTLSTSVYQQEIGRGSRIYRGKDLFHVLDYGDNWKQHGLYFEDRPYSELWNKKKMPGEKLEASSAKACPACECLIPISARICQYCDYEFPIHDKPMQQGEAVDITQEYFDMVGRKVSDLSPHELANYAKIKNKKQYATRVAIAQEQRRPGFLVQFAAEMKYKRSWFDHQVIPSEPVHFADITLR